MEKSRILFAIIGIIGISIITPTIAGTFNDSKIEQYADGRIICVVFYQNYQKLSGSISSTAEYDDSESEYLLFDYKEFANSFDEFKKKYPTFTIKTRGEAMSFSTFGDLGKNKFGNLTYSTSSFDINNSVHNAVIVNVSDEKWATYYVKVLIGIVFIRKDTKLLVIPYIGGVLTSHGFYTRYLNFGLSVDTIIFNPKNYE